MAPPQPSYPSRSKKSASPADRSEEFMETQRRLKAEAAERRLQSTGTRKAPRPSSGKPRERG
jgi:hypothetical protein